MRRRLPVVVGRSRSEATTTPSSSSPSTFTGDIRVARGPDGWELTADRFEETDRMAVYEAAVELVDRLRGLIVVKLGSDARLDMGPVMESLPGGSRRPHVIAKAGLATARVRVYATGVVTYPDGTVPEPPPIPSWEPSSTSQVATTLCVWLWPCWPCPGVVTPLCRGRPGRPRRTDWSAGWRRAPPG